MSFLYRVLRLFVWVLYALAVVAIVALAFGFVLTLFGADKSVPFAQLVLSATNKFMDPFRGLIAPTPLGTAGVISWSALVAIAAYAVAAWVFSMLADWFGLRIERIRADEARDHKAATTAAVAAPVMAGEIANSAGYSPPAEQQPAVVPVVAPVVAPVVQPVAPVAAAGPAISVAAQPAPVAVAAQAAPASVAPMAQAPTPVPAAPPVAPAEPAQPPAPGA
jgi:uncharacterized protein YggT (Ycf19 family)